MSQGSSSPGIGFMDGPWAGQSPYNNPYGYNPYSYGNSYSQPSFGQSSFGGGGKGGYGYGLNPRYGPGAFAGSSMRTGFQPQPFYGAPPQPSYGMPPQSTYGPSNGSGSPGMPQAPMGGSKPAYQPPTAPPPPIPSPPIPANSPAALGPDPRAFIQPGMAGYDPTLDPWISGGWRG